MNSSGIKRGLATAAITALAVTGIPAIASAQTVAGGQVTFELYSQYSGGASTRNDGNNTTVTLLAGVPAGAGAIQVRFSYMKGGTPVVIQNVVPIDGVATMEWTPPTGVEGAAITAVRAEMLDATNTVIGAPDDNAIVGATIPTNQAAHLNGALRSSVGIGPDNDIVVTGNVTTAGVTVTARGPVVSNPAVVDAPSPAPVVGVPDGNNVRPFSAVVPVGANNTGDAIDEIIVGAVSDAPSSDDVNVYSAYQQIVTAASVAPSSSTVQAGGADDDSSYVFTVTDQNTAPVQGLDIYEATSAGVAADNQGRDADGNPSANGETGTDGKMTVKLRESDQLAAGNAADGDIDGNTQATHYVVDVNQNGTYENGIDYLFKVSQVKYVAQPTSVEISSAKGTAMDDDETSLITLTVKDQNGNPVQGATPVVKVTSDNLERQNNTPVQAGADYTDPQTSTPVVAATGADGKTTFTLDPEDSYRISHKIDAYVNNNGTPQPDAGDAIATALTVVSDTSSITWGSGEKAQVANGTTTTQTGKLAQDGLPAGARGKSDGLAGRTVTISYNPDDNSVLAPQAQQPAGTTRLSDTTATVITGAGGAFGVAVTDPAAPAGQELDNELDADAPGLNAGNRFDDYDADGIQDGFEVSGDSTDATLSIDFLRSVTPTRVVIYNGSTSSEANGLGNWWDGGSDLEPGKGAYGFVRAFNADGVQLSDVNVSMTITEGEFFDENDPFENVAVGAPVDLKETGKTATISTGDNGEGYFDVNIERNAGFDDDGLVSDKITASVGGASDQHDLTWNTEGTPLNPRATDPLTVALSEDQESSILPKARAGETSGSGQIVNYDVMSYDQFGNPTSQDTDGSDNTPLADFNLDDTDYSLNQPVLVAFADEATNQIIEVQLADSERNVYTDDPYTGEFDPTDPGATYYATDPADIRKSTSAINWYEIDFAASTFTLDNQGAERVPVGTTVTEVLTAIDQEGQPVQGMFVDFLRGGPGNDDSDGNNDAFTDRAGKAYYDFVGGSRGTATVTGVIYADNGTRLGTVGPDTVTFGGATPPRTSIIAKLFGANNGAKADKLRVKAPAKAAGAVVKLFKVVGGKRVQVGQKRLGAAGAASFTVKDRNGNKVTKYVAVVKQTVDTKGDQTNPKRVR